MRNLCIFPVIHPDIELDSFATRIKKICNLPYFYNIYSPVLQRFQLLKIIGYV